jgi:hypothetical protein
LPLTLDKICKNDVGLTGLGWAENVWFQKTKISIFLTFFTLGQKNSHFPSITGKCSFRETKN